MGQSVGPGQAPDGAVTGQDGGRPGEQGDAVAALPLWPVGQPGHRVRPQRPKRRSLSGASVPFRLGAGSVVRGYRMVQRWADAPLQFARTVRAPFPVPLSAVSRQRPDGTLVMVPLALTFQRWFCLP